MANRTDAFDVFQRVGIYDPSAPTAVDRRELLEHLLERGFSPEQICEVARQTEKDEFFRIIVRLLASAQVALSARDAAERLGVDVQELLELRVAFALPVHDLDAPDISESFLYDFGMYQLACDLYGRERTLAFCRLLGASVAAVTEGARELALPSVHPVKASELERARAAELTSTNWRAAAEVVTHLMEEHARRATWFIENIIRGDANAAIAFVDLVASTAWTASVDPEDHTRALRRFEQLATSVSAEMGVRVVKFIGDEAMLVGPDADAVAKAAARLCTAVGDEQALPEARGAVAWGQVTARGGDYFGDVVNTAARATKESSPGAIVVTAVVAQQLPQSHWRLAESQEVFLRGVGFVQLVEARLA